MLLGALLANTVVSDLLRLGGDQALRRIAIIMSGSGVVCRIDLILTMNGIIAMKI